MVSQIYAKNIIFVKIVIKLDTIFTLMTKPKPDVISHDKHLLFRNIF